MRESGETWTMEHDLADRLTRVALPRDLVARLRAKDPAKGKGKPECDEEDAAEKLMAVGEVVYRYDAAHNRKEEDYGGRVVRSEFNDANEMTRRGLMTFKYNERGDQTEKVHESGQREVFSYSSSGKLVSYATGHEKSRHLKEVERYLYSPDGERVLGEDVQGKKLSHALWDGSRQIEEWHEVGHGAGKKEKGHFYTRDLGGQLLEQARFTRRGGHTKHGSEDDDWDEWDEVDDRRGDGGAPRKPKLNHVRWYLPDFLGSTALITNHRGRVLERLQAGPWGEPLQGNFKKAVFGYTGHRWEQASGHWSAKFRQLDPRAGRWTQRDPAGAMDGANRYRYARNRPFGMIDGSGLFAEIKDDGSTITIIIPIEFYRGTRYVADPRTHTNMFIPVPRDYDIGPDVQRMMEQMTRVWRLQIEGRFACEVLPDRGPRRLSVRLGMWIGPDRPEGGPNHNVNYFNILQATQSAAFRWGNTAYVAANVGGAIKEPSTTEAHELGHLLNIRDDLLPRSIMTHLERSDTDQVHPTHVEQIVDTWSYHKIKIIVRER